MALATLTIDINARLANLEKDLGKVAHLAEQSAQRMESAFSALGGIGIGAGLVATVKSVIDLGDSMNDLSQRVGINIKDLATWQLAANQSGTSIETVAKGVKGLSKFMTENGDALAKAGVDAKDANGALIQLADLFAALPDGVEKTALAVKLFGKAGMDMIPMLNQGSAGLLDAAEKAKAYGEKMALLAPLADKFNDQLAELALQSKESGMSIATYFLPGLIGISTFLNDIKSGGDRARTALEWLSDSNSEIISGASKIALALTEKRSRGYTGPKDEFGLPKAPTANSAEDFAAFDRATEAYLKEREALKKVSDLLGKERNDKELAYLASLRQSLTVATGDVSEYSKQLLAMTQGAGKDFSQQTKDQALALARQIDVLRENTKAIELRAKVLEKVDRAESAANKTVGEFSFRQDQNVDGIQSRIGMLGKTPQEAKQIEAARAIEKEYQDAVKRVNDELGKIGDIEGISEKTRALTVERDKAMAAFTAALDAEKAAQDKLNASWEYGANEALRKYNDQLNNLAATVEESLVGAFKGAEDALVSFVTTGKLSLGSLFDYIATSLARIAVRETIIKPISESGIFQGMLNGFKFGGGSGGGGYGFGSAGDAGTLLGFAGGGYTGNGARSGGLDGQGGFLAMLHPQETVVDHAAGQAGGIVVNLIEDSSRAGQVRQGNSGGTPVLDIFIEQIRGVIAADISRGNGPVPAALAGTYGLNRAAGAY